MKLNRCAESHPSYSLFSSKNRSTCRRYDGVGWNRQQLTPRHQRGVGCERRSDVALDSHVATLRPCPEIPVRGRCRRINREHREVSLHVFTSSRRGISPPHPPPHLLFSSLYHPDIFLSPLSSSSSVPLSCCPDEGSPATIHAFDVLGILSCAFLVACTRTRRYRYPARAISLRRLPTSCRRASVLS